MEHTEIFKGLLVVELSSALAGPSVGMFFAELGARVVKIENKKSGGDVTRRWKHPSEKKEDPYSAYYFATNWNKESILLDLKDHKSSLRLLELIKTADIVVANFKQGSAEKLGMDYQSLKLINPSLIYSSINAYGAGDPRPGFDALMQAEAGWMSINGSPNGPPTKVPLPLIDILAGHQLKEGILIALLHRTKTGYGSEVSVSLYDAAVSALANQAATFLNLDITPERNGSRHPSIAPYGDTVFTSDGQYFLLAVGTNEQFLSLCDLLHIGELKTDARFKDNTARQLHRDDLIHVLQQKIEQLSSDSFIEGCKRYSIPIGPIRNIREVLSSDQAAHLILKEDNSDRVSKRVKTATFKIKFMTS